MDKNCKQWPKVKGKDREYNGRTIDPKLSNVWMVCFQKTEKTVLKLRKPKPENLKEVKPDHLYEKPLEASKF
uniref:Uncharacterized protein n=1 Tax=Romanomermis culicivorax TaxID=13658 RepID=A0A915ITH9_ROMCU